MTPNNVVNGYDLLSIPLPDTPCEIVLVKDCSALNLFIVTTKKVQDIDKKVKME